MSTAEDLTLLDLVDRLYHAAINPDKWRDFLGAASRRFGSRGANLLHINHQNPALSVSMLVGYDHVSVEARQTALDKQVELEGEDPRILFSLSHPHQAFRCTDVMRVEDFHETRVYQEILQPYGIEYSLMVGYSDVPEIFTGLAFHRGPNQQPFSPGDCDVLTALVPHLRRAAAIQNHIFALDEQMRTTYQALETLPTAMLIVAEDGRIDFMNRAACTLFDLADGFNIQDNRITACRRSDDLAIHSAIRQSAAGGSLEPLQLERPSGRPAFQCLVTRIAPPTSSALPGLVQPRVAVYLNNPDDPFEISAHVLQRLFGLTATEGRVLERIVAGRGVNETAADLGIAVSTARSHLSALFAKIGAHTQAALVQKALLSPLWIARINAGR